MEEPVILAIESSCDDTAAAVMAGGRLRSSVVSSQADHEAFGGVVPEVASRNHQRLIVPVVQQALSDAGCTPGDLDAAAVTRGPGLSGSLLVGLSFAKAFAFGLDCPLLGINHLEGHLYSVFIEAPTPAMPFLCLVASGGHTELVRVEANLRHHTLGRTRDDAAGEAFDKVAQLLELGYPGGPDIDRLAQNGDPAFHDFPRSRPGRYDFSFSGLKTSVLYYLNDVSDAERDEHLQRHRPDICASFQEAVVDVLVGALREAAAETKVAHAAIVGGVSANSRLRKVARRAAETDGFELHLPKLQYCTDNAAMIAMAAHRRLQLQNGTASTSAAASIGDDLTLTVDPRLALS